MSNKKRVHRDGSMISELRRHMSKLSYKQFKKEWNEHRSVGFTSGDLQVALEITFPEMLKCNKSDMKTRNMIKRIGSMHTVRWVHICRPIMRDTKRKIIHRRGVYYSNLNPENQKMFYNGWWGKLRYYKTKSKYPHDKGYSKLIYLPF